MGMGSETNDIRDFPISSNSDASVHASSAFMLSSESLITPTEATMTTKDGTDDIAKQAIDVNPDPYPIQAKASHEAIPLKSNTTTTPTMAPISVSYKECQRNHAASMGAVVMDGCGEFMPMPTPCTPQQQQQQLNDLKCAACGCHRNFHRKQVEALYSHSNRAKRLTNDHCPLSQIDTHLGKQVPLQSVMPVRAAFGTDNSSSEETDVLGQPKKRFRTKFSAEQKAKMSDFAEQMGWRVQRSDDAMVRQFCAQVGVKRRVFKVWIHNQKQAMKKKRYDSCYTN